MATSVVFWMYLLIQGKPIFELLEPVTTLEECYALGKEVMEWPIQGDRPLGLEIRVGCTAKFPATWEN